MISNCRLNRLVRNRFLALIFLAGAVRVQELDDGDVYRLPVSAAIQVFALIAEGLKKKKKKEIGLGLDTLLWFLYESTKRRDDTRHFARVDLKDERAVVYRRESRSDMMLMFIEDEKS